MLSKSALGLAAALLTATLAPADVWDVGSDNDNDSGSDNEIVHGMSQVHDLAAQGGGTIQDVDWFTFRLPNARSFEIRIDGLTADVSNGTTSPSLQALESDATTVSDNSEPITNFGVARSLRILPGLAPGVGTGFYNSFVRVSNPACALTCVGNDQYRIRAFDTTLALPRFNNGAGQVTVLMLQNPTGKVVTGIVHALSGSGTVLASFNFALQPYATGVTNLATVSSGVLNGQSGSLLIPHNAPYGTLAGKGVAVEPATGFTFDTALSHVAN